MIQVNDPFKNKTRLESSFSIYLILYLKEWTFGAVKI
jgi:hypothetical protein